VFTKRWMEAQAAMVPQDQIGRGSFANFLKTNDWTK